MEFFSPIRRPKYKRYYFHSARPIIVIFSRLSFPSGRVSDLSLFKNNIIFIFLRHLCCRYSTNLIWLVCIPSKQTLTTLVHNHFWVTHGEEILYCYNIILIQFVSTVGTNRQYNCMLVGIRGCCQLSDRLPHDRVGLLNNRCAAFCFRSINPIAPSWELAWFRVHCRRLSLSSAFCRVRE